MNNEYRNSKVSEDGVEKESLLREGERLDDLQTGGYCLIQNPSLFCFGIDAVLLSSFAKVKKGERALDLGTGTGIVPILLEAKNEGAFYGGLEIQEVSADIARRSVKYNNLEGKIEIRTGDIKEAAEIYGAASFEVITVNPPYMIQSHGVKNVNDSKYIARHEVYCTLRDVLEQSAKLLKEKGRFYMVHRPFRLPEIMKAMCECRLEPKRMRMVHSYVDKEPSMVLIEGLRSGRPRMRVEPPLIVYEKDGQYTEEALRMYGEMKKFPSARTEKIL
ncbi:MAG: tRNA1(Val) (adenine(37)-N6)-methyltransferase [Dorea sp.]|jgi:tRNA1Val (adenine37-N6)-methyltransferase|nr:tRNA1(Val) (adenine(37)-N6)-methyltransferase [Dorea sp.]